MFTGIVEELGVIKNTTKNSLLIEGSKVLEGTLIGDSICTNGVCLTVTNIYDKDFEVNVMEETLERSNLADLKRGSKVNLERALRLDTRLGGHIVSGHIDGVGIISNISRNNNETWIEVKVDKELIKYIVSKGSVAIDGISLTVAYVLEESFKVSIIPHTSKETTLLSNKIYDTVNIECDIIGKYVEKLVGLNKKKDVTESFLRENGFL